MTVTYPDEMLAIHHYRQQEAQRTAEQYRGALGLIRARRHERWVRWSSKLSTRVPQRTGLRNVPPEPAH